MADRYPDTEARDMVQNADTPSQPGSRDTETEFDDGLVHNHGWACRERGAPAN